MILSVIFAQIELALYMQREREREREDERVRDCSSVDVNLEENQQPTNVCDDSRSANVRFFL